MNELRGHGGRGALEEEVAEVAVKGRRSSDRLHQPSKNAQSTHASLVRSISTAISLTRAIAWARATRQHPPPCERTGLGTHKLGRLPVPTNYDVWADSVLDEALALSEQLCSEEDDARRAVSNLRVLRARNVDERLGSGVHDLEELENRRTIVRDRGLPVSGHNELVHPTRSEGRRNRVGDGEAGGDVG